ncbi:exportin-1-like isoform X1 [Brachionus plicatilis]|uniref:Exportin-1-like isoform X1 n=1 Tax=Brachionus plicatilis TaxID=10195 RepID=A0A3M7S577_BRAPC|nr:exportin-1-like isoform X1 [Brachionus plicatilis]
MRDVAEIGLEILLKLLINIREQQEAAQQFYQSFYIEIMQHVFAVVTDTSHIAGLTYHSQILAHLFSLLENNNILVPLAPEVQNPAQNIEYVQQHVFNLLKTAYPHLQEINRHYLQYKNKKNLEGTQRNILKLLKDKHKRSITKLLCSKNLVVAHEGIVAILELID